MNPAQVLVLGFLAVIVVGTLLLLLPAATREGQDTEFLTALFTATSAVCVTGLIVVDTGTHWTTLGHVVILFLIQVGGLGIMTMSTMAAMVIGRKVSLRERLVIREAMGHVTLEGMVRLVRLILVVAVIFEGIGAIILTLHWSRDYPLARAAFLGVFHSVSAFNNAGFDLFSVSLMGYVNDPVTNVTVMVLIVSGGLGFVVMAEIFRRLRTGRSYRFSLHSKIVLTASVLLWIGGAVFLLLAEASNPDTMGQLSWMGRTLSSVFTSVTPRTAGFNTLPTGSLRLASLLMIIGLMFVGGSPGSTAGGVKTTTVFILLASVFNTIRKRVDVELYGRRLDPKLVMNALAIVVLGSFLVFVVTLVLLLSLEGAEFIDCLFETVSAFGTVGLSTGITSRLNSLGRVAIIATMFIGRLGPLTLMMAMRLTDQPDPRYRHPREDIMIG